MMRLIALLLTVATPLLACQLLPTSGMTCDRVAPEVCEEAFEQVRALFRGSGEVVQSASVSPTGRADCLHDELPLADVIVRLEGKPDPVLVTISRTLAGEPSICF